MSTKILLLHNRHARRGASAPFLACKPQTRTVRTANAPVLAISTTCTMGKVLDKIILPAAIFLLRVRGLAREVREFKTKADLNHVYSRQSRSRVDAAQSLRPTRVVLTQHKGTTIACIAGAGIKGSVALRLALGMQSASRALGR